MFLNQLKRIIRAPLPALAVLLFMTILCTVLCGLEVSNKTERQDFENAFNSLAVDLEVTDLSASQSANLEIPVWISELFTGESRRTPKLDSYIKDLQMASVLELTPEKHLVSNLFGANCAEACTALSPSHGGEVIWFDGYDESFFLSEEYLCLVPQVLADVDDDPDEPGQQIHLSFGIEDGIPDNELEIFRQPFTIVGTYTSLMTAADVFCPLNVIAPLSEQQRVSQTVYSIHAVLADNNSLQELRTVASNWFAEPNPMGQQTEWGEYGYDFYLYALDINDEMLHTLTSALKSSILINELCTGLVFALSAGAGFLIGFLMIRSRKREIALMRTMGTPNAVIYGGFAFEQMICVVLGTLLGGGAFLWQPVGQLFAFLGIYFVGLSIALLVFLNTNLISTIKEDE